MAFQQVVEQTLTVKRVHGSMAMCQFVLAMVLAAYVGFSRLNNLRRGAAADVGGHFEDPAIACP
jgi:hypothetical protein